MLLFNILPLLQETPLIQTRRRALMEAVVLFTAAPHVSHENYLYFHYPLMNIWVSMVTQLRSISGCRLWDGLAKAACSQDDNVVCHM